MDIEKLKDLLEQAQDEVQGEEEPAIERLIKAIDRVAVALEGRPYWYYSYPVTYTYEYPTYTITSTGSVSSGTPASRGCESSGCEGSRSENCEGIH